MRFLARYIEQCFDSPIFTSQPQGKRKKEHCDIDLESDGSDNGPSESAFDKKLHCTEIKEERKFPLSRLGRQALINLETYEHFKLILT